MRSERSISTQPGLIVAEKDGRIVGFVHAGFGPDLPVESFATVRSSAMSSGRSPCWWSSPTSRTRSWSPG